MITIQYAYQRFCTERFPLPSEQKLLRLEARLQLELPDDFPRFILDFNGGYFSEPSIMPVAEGCPEDELSFLCGIDASDEEAVLGSPFYLSLFDDNFPPKVLPIGGTPMGSLILLDTAPGEDRGSIYFKEAFGDAYFLADGIAEFFELLQDPTVE